MNIFAEIQEYSILIKALENSRLSLDIDRRRYYIKKKNQLIDEAAKNLDHELRRIMYENHKRNYEE